MKEGIVTRCVVVFVFLLIASFSSFLLTGSPSSNAGEFKSTGLGAWTKTLESDSSFADLMHHPTIADLFFACDGQNIFRSEDSGATWNTLLTGEYNFTCMDISPAAPDIILLGGYNLTHNDHRVYRYECNTGAISQIGDRLPGQIYDIAVSTSSITGPVYVATGQNATGGEVWTCNPIGSAFYPLNNGLPQEPGVINITISPSDNNNVLAGTWDQGIYKLDGSTWSLSSTGFPTGSSPEKYAAAVSVEFEPREGNVVLAGTNGAGIYRSDDGGNNWFRSDFGIEYDTPNAKGFAFDPDGSGLVWSAVWPMGVYCSSDFGNTWYLINSGGLFGNVGNLKLENIALNRNASSLVVGEWLPNSEFPYNDKGACYHLKLPNYYFAEGYTGEGFDEWLCLANFSPTQSIVNVMYVYPDRPISIKTYNVKANSRLTVNVNNDSETSGDVSVRVISDSQVVAERPMYFDYEGWCTGGHNVIGVSCPSGEWFFAEGYTGPGFNEWLCMANFGSSDANVRVSYIYPDKPPLTKDYSLDAGRRRTLNVNLESETSGDVSLHVRSDNPIVAERPIYFNYMEKWTGGHNVSGAMSPETVLLFAEGYTGEGFDEWLCLMNPQDRYTANVNINYYFGSGAPVQFYYTIEPEKRLTINVNEDAAHVGHANESVSLEIISDLPIVAERPMYFNYAGKWPGGHNVMGIPAPAKEFFFAEGYTGEGFEVWLSILVKTTTAKVNVTYIFPDGEPVEKTYKLSGPKRTTLNVNNESQKAHDVSIKVESDFPIVVERPIYFNYSDKWTGGHNVVGETF